jgi:hypothetical protein
MGETWRGRTSDWSSRRRRSFVFGVVLALAAVLLFIIGLSTRSLGDRLVLVSPIIVLAVAASIALLAAIGLTAASNVVSLITAVVAITGGSVWLAGELAPEPSGSIGLVYSAPNVLTTRPAQGQSRYICARPEVNNLGSRKLSVIQDGDAVVFPALLTPDSSHCGKKQSAIYFSPPKAGSTMRLKLIDVDSVGNTLLDVYFALGAAHPAIFKTGLGREFLAASHTIDDVAITCGTPQLCKKVALP